MSPDGWSVSRLGSSKFWRAALRSPTQGWPDAGPDQLGGERGLRWRATWAQPRCLLRWTVSVLQRYWVKARRASRSCCTSRGSSSQTSASFNCGPQIPADERNQMRTFTCTDNRVLDGVKSRQVPDWTVVIDQAVRAHGHAPPADVKHRCLLPGGGRPCLVGRARFLSRGPAAWGLLSSILAGRAAAAVDWCPAGHALESPRSGVVTRNWWWRTGRDTASPDRPQPEELIRVDPEIPPVCRLLADTDGPSVYVPAGNREDDHDAWSSRSFENTGHQVTFTLHRAVAATSTQAFARSCGRPIDQRPWCR